MSVSPVMSPLPLDQVLNPALKQFGNGLTSSSKSIDHESPVAARNDRPSGMYHLRKVKINELEEDEALGLLLHGTAIAGFYSEKAKASGWCVGDQIVEVNGRRVGSFDEFLTRFHQAKSEGMPMNFFVLRREASCEVGDSSEFMEDLQGFFDSANFGTEVSSMLQSLLERPCDSNTTDLRRLPNGGFRLAAKCSWPEGTRLARDQQGYRILVPYSERRDPETCPEAKDLRRLEIPQKSKRNFKEFAQKVKADLILDTIVANPYVQALRARRQELTRGVDDPSWAGDELTTPLPSRLATSHDGLAMLAVERSEAKRDCCSDDAEGIPRECESQACESQACASEMPYWRCCGGSVSRCRPGPASQSDVDRDFLLTPRPQSMAAFDGDDPPLKLPVEAQQVLSESRIFSLDYGMEGNAAQFVEMGDTQRSTTASSEPFSNRNFATQFLVGTTE